MSNTYIYGLIDPRDNKLKYVGATTTGDRRYYQHCQIYYLKKSTLKNNWIKSLLSQNLKPNLHIIQFCEKEHLAYLEKYYINFFNKRGYALLNHNNEGYGIRPKIKTSEEQKRNASLNFTKYPIINLETREIFECVYDVLKKYPKFTYTGLASVLQKSKKVASYNGMFFSYYIEGIDIKKELEDRKSRSGYKKNTGKHCRKKVQELTTGLVFDSIKEASIYFNVNSTNISHSLAGRKKSTREFRFKYV